MLRISDPPVSVRVVRNHAATVKSLAGLIAETLAGVYLTACRVVVLFEAPMMAMLNGSLKFAATRGGTFVEGVGSGEAAEK
jgi:hypothetical protein